MMHEYGMLGHVGTMGPFMWLTMILFWGLIIFSLVYLVRWIALNVHHDDRNK